MFDCAQPALRSYRLPALLSAAAHGILLMWLLHRPEPRLVAPHFVVHGEKGIQIAHLYLPTPSSATASDSTPGTMASSAQVLLNSRLTLQPDARAAKPARQKPSTAHLGQDSETSSPGQPAQRTAAGSPLGTVLDGPLSGDEVRPALPVLSRDPVVEAGELHGLQGDVIVEVTIDAQGSIVQKVVLQSLTPAVDAKVLEALDSWHFRPATRNGVAIPSKQDVYYHFPRITKGDPA